MKRRLVAFLVLSLLLLLPACGGSEGNNTSTPATIQTATVATTATSDLKATPTSMEPVKIGIISPWSGPMALAGQMADQVVAIVQQQLKDMGGILGGRQVEFVRGDDKGTVADAVTVATKLVLQDKVDMLLMGGMSGAQQNAVAKVGEEYKVPYVSISVVFGSATMKYSIAVYTTVPQIGRISGFIIDYVKPQTVAWLGFDDFSLRHAMDGTESVTGVRKRLKDAGINLIYEQWYPSATIDLTSYLSTIKYRKPDLLVIAVNGVSEALTINQQIMELGGWGDIKLFNCLGGSTNQKVVAMPVALGSYTSMDWMPGSDEPGMKAFEDAFKKLGRSPTPELSYYYNDIWTGIKAIEMAGTTDHDKVAQAMRSGNLAWDSAWGPLRIRPDGEAVVTLNVAEVHEGGKLVKVWTWNPE